MKTGLSLLSMFALLILAASAAHAQTPASSSNQNPPQQAAPQKPAAPQSSGTNANPFPEDSDAVPVIGSSAAAPAAPAMDDAAAGMLLPPDDSDPAKSPDEAHGTGNGQFSSSSAGMDELLPDQESGSINRHGRPVEPEHHADAKENESVGEYYLGLKNWKAALSRFESALVLDPENPDVYWGLAESQRNLGNFAEARQNYVKVMMYDPGSKHAKDAKKILRQPEFEQASTGGAPSAEPKK